MTKAILVSGANGFIGSHLARALVADGRRVVILCRRFSDTSRVRDIFNNLRRIDIDTGNLYDALASVELDGVVHLATKYGRRSETVADVFRANFQFPVELLDVALKRGARFFINTDSFFCKPHFAYSAMPEYTYSKVCFLRWARKNADKIHVANMRLEHVYGPKDGTEKFVPTVLSQMLNPDIREIELTEGRQRRDFVYVTDVADAFRCVIAVAEQAQPGYVAYEVGTGESNEIRTFAEKLKHATSSSANLLFGAIPYRDGEIMESRADLTALSALGYRPKINLDAGISRLVGAARDARRSLVR
jgi:nucleoside-diphosphate-sugar epimerase